MCEKLANCWQQIELASILANFFANLFCVGKLESDVWTLGQHVLVIINQSKRALLTCFICVSKWETRANTFKFIEAVHNYPAVWDVSSLAYKDTNKNKQNKTKRRSALTNWVSSKSFYFSTAFCFFSSFPLFHCCTWVLLHLKTAMLQITVFVIWHEFDVWGKEFVNFSKFSNTSLPT